MGYDFFIYGLIAPLVFDQLFFPKFDQLTATIAVSRDVVRRISGATAGRARVRPFRRLAWAASPSCCALCSSWDLRPWSIGLVPTYWQRRRDSDCRTRRAALPFRALRSAASRPRQSSWRWKRRPGQPARLLRGGDPGGRARRRRAGVVGCADDFAVAGGRPAVLGVARPVPDQCRPRCAWHLYACLRIEESPTFREARKVRSGARRRSRSGPTGAPILIVFFAEMAQTSYFYLTAIFTISLLQRANSAFRRTSITQAVRSRQIWSASLAMPLVRGPVR